MPDRNVFAVDGTRHVAQVKDAGSPDMWTYRGDGGRGPAVRDACKAPRSIFRSGI